MLSGMSLMLSDLPSEWRLWEGAGSSGLLDMGELPALGTLLPFTSLDTTSGCPDRDGMSRPVHEHLTKETTVENCT